MVTWQQQHFNYTYNTNNKDAFDVDGNKYVDYVGSWGPAICGHANDQVNAALIKQLEKGTSFGAPCELENTLAKMVIVIIVTMIIIMIYGGE